MDRIEQLQENIQNIRNICIIAHVDHGKTTLSDMLLSSNGIISQKLAGKIRYLDSREDEQERGITMESSAISLFFSLVSGAASNPIRKDYLINLIDSPGHVDFSSEVSTASRLCDGALVLVDAVEGVCAQTHTVLRQALREKVRPVLILNKIDRLILELRFTPMEAFTRLSQILEQVNAILGTYEAQEILEEDVDQDADTETKDNDDFYFSPEKGNVIFASAIDGWAFRTNQFARLYASKLNVKESNLERFLWGKYYLDPKTKRIIGPKLLKGRNLKPLFVQFILDNLWKVYETVIDECDADKTVKIVQSLNLKISPRDLKSKDTKSLLQNIMSQWLPLSQAVLLAVIQKVPNPRDAQMIRMEQILNPLESYHEETKDIMKYAMNCDATDDAPIVAYLSKVFSASKKDLPAKVTQGVDVKHRQDRQRLLEARAKARQLLEEQGISPGEEEDPVEPQPQEDDEVLIGFCRIYSGTIRIGQTIQVLGPKFDINDPERDSYRSELVVKRLFLMMGRELKDLDHVKAGNVFGILVSSSAILKTATLSSSIYCPSLAGLKLEAPPILEVALEPMNPTQLNQLAKGLDLLNRADPCVQVALQETGEYVMRCAGELHVERCLKDLRERFAKIEIQASKPLVPFRETLTFNPSLLLQESIPVEQLGTVQKSKSDNSVSVSLRTIPMPPALLQFLQENQNRVAEIEEGSLESLAQELIEEMKNVVKEDVDTLDIKVDWNSLLDNIVSLGSKTNFTNLLCVEGSIDADLWKEFGEKTKLQYYSSVLLGFQMGTANGPLCAEPMSGVVVIIQENQVDPSQSDSALTIPGQIVSFFKDGIKQGFLNWSPRLMLAMYSCEIQTDPMYLGSANEVISRRRGKIIAEDVKDGTMLFTITALLPIIESFGFVEEIRTSTSGVAQPQLLFHGFEILDEDPYWVPNTEEELEDLGELAERDNLAKKYLEAVRIRKGMAVQRRMADPEKQKNLKNK